VFERLVREVRELSVPADSTALVELFAVRDALDAVLSSAVAEFDAAELLDLDAATSMTAWLRDRAGVTRRDAARAASKATSLRPWPCTREAWQDGLLSGGQVEVILANVGRHRDLFAGHETTIVPTLTGLSMEDTIRVMTRWRACADAEHEPAEPPEPERSLHVSEMSGGRVVLDGNLDPELGALVRTGLRLAETRDLDGEPTRTRPNAAPTRWATCSGSSSTTSRPAPAAGTAPTST
jgi:hypothetical protein